MVYIPNTLQGAGLTERKVQQAPYSAFIGPQPAAMPRALDRFSSYISQLGGIQDLNKAYTQRQNALADFAQRELERQRAEAQARQMSQWMNGLGGSLAGSPIRGGRGSSANVNVGKAGSMNYSGLGKQLAAQVGWTGSQWDAFYRLGVNESGWNPNAQNPTSTAYGIGQFLDSTWGTVGGRKTSDPAAQIRYMIKYVQQRYGTPQAALNAWYSRSPHWY